MTVDWTAELVDQLDWHWTNQLLPRLEGLTDDEYFWEPVPGCWSIRARGDGTYAYDYTHPEPNPPPFTTIAWRLGHIGALLRMRVSNHFGDASFDVRAVDWPGSADAGISFVADAYHDWKSAVATLDEAALAQRCGPTEGPYADRSMAALVLHINREVLHHAAEACCLRDLHRDTPAPVRRDASGVS